MEAFRYNSSPSATLQFPAISQEKGNPKGWLAHNNADNALLNQKASMVDRRETSNPAEFELNLGKCLTTIFLHTTEHPNLIASSELKP